MEQGSRSGGRGISQVDRPRFALNQHLLLFSAHSPQDTPRHIHTYVMYVCMCIRNVICMLALCTLSMHMHKYIYQYIYVCICNMHVYHSYTYVQITYILIKHILRMLSIMSIRPKFQIGAISIFRETSFENNLVSKGQLVI